MAYLAHYTADFQPAFSGHVWRAADGVVGATVDLGPRSYLSFADPAEARALAAECVKAAEAMERFEAEYPREKD